MKAGVSYTHKLSCLALPLGGQFDIILGDDWLRQTRAVLSYVAASCTVQHPSKGLLQLVPVPRGRNHARPLPLLSAIAVRRALKTLAVRAFQVHVVDSGVTPWAGSVSSASSGGENESDDFSHPLDPPDPIKFPEHGSPGVKQVLWTYRPVFLTSSMASW